MSEVMAAEILRPIITLKGLAAANQAATLGKPVKITQVGVSNSGGSASEDMATLPGEQFKVTIADGKVVSEKQVNVSALIEDTRPSVDIYALGFYLDDGTLFAVYRQKTPILIHTQGATLLIGMDFAMDNIPADSVIVESTGANLIMGDWVPVQRRVNGKALTADIVLNAIDVNAAPSGFGLGGNGARVVSQNLDLTVANGFYAIYADDTGTPDASGKGPSGSRLVVTSWGPTHVSQMFFPINSSAIHVRHGRPDPSDSKVVKWSGWSQVYTTDFRPPETDLSGMVPKTRKVNNKALDADITLTPADIKAAPETHGHADLIRKAGDSEVGSITAIKGKVFDATLTHRSGYMSIFPFSDSYGTGGNRVRLYYREHEMDKPDKISRGLMINSNDADGTSQDLDIWLNNSRVFHQKRPPTASETGALDTEKGGTMKGAIIAAIMKASIWLKDKASIAFQDSGGVMWHQYASGNALLIGTGNEGGKNTLTMTEAYTEFMNTLYSRTGLITQNSAKTRWLAMETPESGNPYISARASGEANPVQVMEFAKDRVRARKLLHADHMQVGADAGLKFSPLDDLAGVSWGMGIDGATGNLGIHKYTNGVWQGAPFQITPNSELHLTGLIVNGGSESAYHQIRNAGNPTLELHEPGKFAVMAYKPQGKNVLRFAQSNGAGGEAYGMGEVSIYGFETVNGRFAATYSSANRPWNGWGQNAFNMNELSVGNGTLVGIVGGQTHYPGNWQLEFGYAAYTSPDPLLCGHILNCIDNGNSFHRKWQFRNDGYLDPAGGGWHISPNGDLYSSRLGGTNVVDWTIAGFSQLGHGHDAAQGNLSMVQGRHSEVGTYMFAALNPSAGGPYNPGMQAPGSLLYPAACGEWSQNRGWTFPGTWMCCGYVDPNNDDRYDDRSTLWFRVA